MADSVGITWITPPSELAEAIKKYGDRVEKAVAAVAGRSATIMANNAKRSASWEDRTGNARSGIFGTSEADFSRHVVTIFLSHGVAIDYGIWLELANSGKYSIIMKTMQAHLPELHSMLKDIFA